VRDRTLREEECAGMNRQDPGRTGRRYREEGKRGRQNGRKTEREKVRREVRGQQERRQRGSRRDSSRGEMLGGEQ